MIHSSKPRSEDERPWAPPRVGVPVERRDAWELATHGARAGLLAGLALGLVEILASAVLRGDPWLPFEFATAIVVGPEALSPGFPVAASVMLGTVIHVLLSVVFGIGFLAVTGSHVSAECAAVPGASLRCVVRHSRVGSGFPRGTSGDRTGVNRAPRSCDAAVEWNRVVLLRVRSRSGRVRHLGPSRYARSLVGDRSRRDHVMEATHLLEIGFPIGIRVAHAFNIVFLTLLFRSGIEILGGHPMLYFNDHCRPGSEWIRFTSKRMFRNQRWTAEDEKQPYTSWLALPGRDNLGLGRFWHFTAVLGWLLTGLTYLLVLAIGEQWQR